MNIVAPVTRIASAAAVLVQLDASVRAWLGGRGDEPVLISMIDASVDVTNGTSLRRSFLPNSLRIRKLRQPMSD